MFLTVLGIYNTPNELQLQSFQHYSQNENAFNNVFMDLTDIQVEEIEIDGRVNEQGKNYNMELYCKLFEY